VIRIPFPFAVLLFRMDHLLMRLVYIRSLQAITWSESAISSSGLSCLAVQSRNVCSGDQLTWLWTRVCFAWSPAPPWASCLHRYRVE
jgi:hypothetical protein